MLLKSTLYIALFVAYVTCLLHAEAQPAPPTSGVTQSAVTSIDPRAADVLKQLDATYKSMRSFSTEIEDDWIRRDGTVFNSQRSKISYRRPSNFTANRIDGPDSSEVRTDGRHAYISFSGTPNEYTEISNEFKSTSPFIVTVASPHSLGMMWLDSFLTDDGYSPNYLQAHIRSLSIKREGYVGYQPMDVITEQRSPTAAASKEWETLTFTIGVRDHLLYKETIEDGVDPTVHVARYNHPQSNPTLPDSVFQLPNGAIRLPLFRVTHVSDVTISLDKGRLDGASVGDELLVFTDDRLISCNADILITETKAHESTALVISNTAGIYPGEVCVKIKHDKEQLRAILE